MKAEIDRRNALFAGGKNSSDADKGEGEEKGETRKRSNRNVKNYRKLVVADNDELQQRYKNEYRGRVQNRNVKVELEPMFVLTYYRKDSEVERTLNFHKLVDELNNKQVMGKRLYITNQEKRKTCKKKISAVKKVKKQF